MLGGCKSVCEIVFNLLDSISPLYSYPYTIEYMSVCEGMGNKGMSESVSDNVYNVSENMGVSI